MGLDKPGGGGKLTLTFSGGSIWALEHVGVRETTSGVGGGCSRLTVGVDDTIYVKSAFGLASRHNIDYIILLRYGLIRSRRY